MSQKPRILITNDDGIHAPGLAALAGAMAELGETTIVAPDTERSAAGHAITMLHILRAFPIDKDGKLYGKAVNGTPADCVKLALSNLLGEPPHLVVSGINPGPNTGTNVLYSGTVSAAMEGAIYGIPSLAVSMGTLKNDQDFSPGAHYAKKVAARILEKGLPKGIMLNLNVPSLPLAEIKGLKSTFQSIYQYHDSYERRHDPRGREYYWLSLEDASVMDESPEADANAVAEGFASLTPLSLNLTQREFLGKLNDWLG